MVFAPLQRYVNATLALKIALCRATDFKHQLFVETTFSSGKRQFIGAYRLTAFIAYSPGENVVLQKSC
jgi:hypothetical protein